jgi:predicted ATP-grasp superfamily ATP-dependent carboligase
MKKILVLGVGDAQVDFIRHCKKHGYIVYSCSYKNEGRGIQESDFFELINISDVDRIKEHVRRNDIDLVYSVGSDIAMPSIARVSHDLKKNHFISAETAITCNNKSKLRNTLRQVAGGEYSVYYLQLYDKMDTVSWDRFPAMVKPVDSQGQRGITKVCDHDGLKKAFAVAIEASPTKSAIIEEFIEGFEISVNSYMVDGRPMFFFLTERISFDQYPGGIIKSHLFPVTRPLNEPKVQKLVEQTASYLNINNGPVYFQIKINNGGDPKIIEVTPRFDGCHLWRLIKMLGGPDLFEVTLNHLSGCRIHDSIFDEKKVGKAGAAELSFFTQPPQTAMNKNDFHVSDNAQFVEWFYENGEIIRPINGYQEKTGYQITVEK